MSGNSIYRYPGPEPFRYDQQEIFFGRGNDIERLKELVGAKQQTLLYGKSGLGKSSLIEAGLIPGLMREGEVLCIRVRLGVGLGSHTPTPCKSIHAALDKNLNDSIPDTFLSRIIADEGSLWFHLKALALAQKIPDRIVLVFDQFEELFSHPEESVFEFKQQMADVLYRVVPLRFRAVLDIKQREDPDILSKAELNRLLLPVDVRVLYAIREDRYSELNGLLDFLPDILQNRYQLTPLGLDEAKDAIVKPAGKKGDFETAPFLYSDAALTKILKHLNGGHQNTIESTILQILCSSIEKKGIAEVQEDDVADFEDIYLQFYLDSINALDDSDRIHARKLVEDKFVRHGRRIPMDQLDCEEYLSKTAIRTLLSDRHLLRAENNSTGGTSYELSHDVLVAPILLAKKTREFEEELQSAENERIAQAKRDELEAQKRKEEAEERIAEMARIAEEKRVREELSREQASREKEKEQLRRTRLALIVALTGILIAGAALTFAVLQGRQAIKSGIDAKKNEAEAIEARATADSLRMVAEGRLMQYEEAEKARIKSEVDKLLLKADSFRRNGEREIGIETLEAALKMDSTRVDIKQKIIEWKQ